MGVKLGLPFQAKNDFEDVIEQGAGPKVEEVTSGWT
jgi:hypothetical protein